MITLLIILSVYGGYCLYLFINDKYHGVCPPFWMHAGVMSLAFPATAVIVLIVHLFIEYLP